MTERYTVRVEDHALYVVDQHTGQRLPEGYSLRYPTTQRAAIRFMQRLEREHREQEARHEHRRGEADAFSPVS